MLFQANEFSQHKHSGSFRVDKFKFHAHTILDVLPSRSLSFSVDGIFYMPLDWQGDSHKYEMRGLIFQKCNTNRDVDEYERFGVFGWKSNHLLEKRGLNAGKMGLEYIRLHVHRLVIKIV